MKFNCTHKYKKELKKNDYYIKKNDFVNVVTNIFIIVVLFILFIQFYIYNGIQIFGYRLFASLYGILFVCFVGILLLKKLNNKVLKITKKYDLDIIPTFTDMWLKNTIRLSLQQIENNRSIIIFPEN